MEKLEGERKSFNCSHSNVTNDDDKQLFRVKFGAAAGGGSKSV